MLCKVDTQTDGTFRLKLVTIIVGIIDVILGAVGSCGHKNDIYFLVTILVIFSLSLLLLMCTLLDIFKTNVTSRGMDFIFHLIGGALIMISSLVLISSTNPQSCRVMEKTSAVTIGIFNSFIYIYICWLILQTLRQKDQGPLFPLYFFCGCSRSQVFYPGEPESPMMGTRRSSQSIPVRLSNPNRGRITTQESMMVKSSATDTPVPVET